MKTAISLPDALYERAEETADYMGVARSQLFVLALEEYLENHNRQMIIDKINAVCDSIDQEKEFSLFQHTGLEVLRESTKNDVW